MNPVLIYNRRLTLQPDGRIEVLRLGEYPHAETGQIEVVDETAMAKVLAAFNREAAQPGFAGVLVDDEHFSYDPAKSTDAMAWITRLTREGDVLVGNAEMSDLGRAAVAGNRKKFQSPVLDVEPLGGNRVRPVRLDTVGLTNRPVMKNLAAVTLLNRTAPAGNGDAKPQTQGAVMLKEQLISALGLAADADEAAIVAAVTALKKQTEAEPAPAADAAPAELKNRLAAVQAERDALLGEQVERDLAEHAGVIANKAIVKQQLLANRAGTLEFLKALKAPEKPALHNRATARPPQADPTAVADEQTAAVALKNRAHNLRRANPNLTFTEAWQQAREETAAQ